MVEPSELPVLTVESLDVAYSTRMGTANAVSNVSFEIYPGQVLGLVGESGCGKSTLAFAVMNYLADNANITNGQILFRGREIVGMSGRDLNHIRGNEIAMVYQDPMASLNPSMLIGPQLTEVLMQHKGLSEADAREACTRMLERVQMPDPETMLNRYCHQLSGGQQQRVLIAMALLTKPALLIMDEPTTGLDVTVEAEILDLVSALKQQFDTTILFISHSLGVISKVADRVAVMYAGELVEEASVHDIFLNPQHPYTAGLLGFIPKISTGRERKTLRPITKVEPVLEVAGLRTYYKAKDQGFSGMAGKYKKGFVKAVDNVNLLAGRKSTMGIVGESGCGKTTLAKCVAGLVPPNDGNIDYLGIDIAMEVEQRPVDMLKELQMIFQNPDATLNPRRSVGESIARPLQLFGTVPRSEIRAEVLRLLNAVRLGEEYYDRLPRQLSGGEKQRVAIARAFAGRPSLVLCDEPLSALDVSVQAAVMDLLREFQQEYGTAILFISHDFGAVYQLCDFVSVMYLGKVCETGSTEALFEPPYHPYTEALLSAVPIPDPTVERTNIRLSGTVPSALDPPEGCRFHTRCPRKIGSICETESPPCRTDKEGHEIYCHIDIDKLRDVQPLFGGN